MTTVALFGSEEDAEVDALAKRLRNRGAEAWIIDLADYPKRLRITWDRASPRVNGRSISDIDISYLRRVGRNALPHAQYGSREPVRREEEWAALHGPTVEWFSRELANQSARTALLCTVARRCLMINPPHAQNLHRQKPFEFGRIAAAGLPVPAYRAGTRRASMERFVEEGVKAWDGVVNKPMAGIYKTALWNDAFIRPFGERPALAQRFIRGDTVRCFVLAGKLLSAARIVHRGTVDSSMSQTGIDPIELSPEQRAIAQGTAQSLDLAFCGIDLMIDAATGETWVIDCNLSPMFVNYARLSGCDVPGHIASYMLEHAGHERDPSERRMDDLVAEAKQAIEGEESIRKYFRALRLRGRGQK